MTVEAVAAQVITERNTRCRGLAIGIVAGPQNLNRAAFRIGKQRGRGSAEIFGLDAAARVRADADEIDA